MNLKEDLHFAPICIIFVLQGGEDALRGGFPAVFCVLSRKNIRGSGFSVPISVLFVPALVCRSAGGSRQSGLSQVSGWVGNGASS
jgi:hypothetical protein